MSEQVTVFGIESQKPWASPDGSRSFKIVNCTLTDSQGQPRQVAWFRKPDADDIQVGDNFTGEFFEKNGKPRFRLASAESSGLVGASPRTEGASAADHSLGLPPPLSTQDHIERQHSQEMALRYLAIKAQLGKLPALTPELVATATDHFQKDISCPLGASEPERNETPAPEQPVPDLEPDNPSVGAEIPF